MDKIFSPQLVNDISATTAAAAFEGGVINISRVAEAVRRRNAAENVALEDIEYAIVAQGQLLNVAIEFDRHAMEDNLHERSLSD